jgi:hypothetical protein
MDVPSQNAFVSGWPKKASGMGQVGTGGWFPRSANQEKAVTIIFSRGCEEDAL